MGRLSARPQRSRERVLVPARRLCVSCGGVARARYENRRTLVMLSGPVRLRLKIRRCDREGCARHRVPYRPEAEGALALPHLSTGLEVWFSRKHGAARDCTRAGERPLTSPLQLTMVRARVVLRLLPGSRLALRRADPFCTGPRDNPGSCARRTRRVSCLRHRLASHTQPTRSRAPRPVLAGSPRLAAASLPALPLHPSGLFTPNLHRAAG